MKYRLIFLIASPFQDRDEKRFGINLIASLGIDVEVWEISYLADPADVIWVDIPTSDDKAYLKRLNNDDEVFFCLSKLDSRDRVISMLGHGSRNIGIYKQLRKQNISFGQSILGLTPADIDRTSNWLRRLTELYYSPSLLLTYVAKHLKTKIRKGGASTPQPDFMVVGGAHWNRTKYYSTLTTPEIVHVHSYDYESFRQEKEGESAALISHIPYLVYLDQNFGSVVKAYRGRPLCNTNTYYDDLNRFFSLVEDKIGMEVVIAAHPKWNVKNQSHPFGGRSIIQNKTANLVGNSAGVLANYSTSIHLAVLYRKPLTFLDSKDYSYFVRSNTKLFAKELDATLINIQKRGDTDIVNLSRVTEDKYREFVQKYIKEQSSPDGSLWGVVCDYLDQRRNNFKTTA